MVKFSVCPSGVTDKKVLKAMLSVPRHLFVPRGYKQKAYLDIALPIGENQTISQPSLVGLIAQLLHLRGSEKILEVGTGSGYQAAILGLLAKQVYSIEIIEFLYKRARRIIKRLKYKNIHLYQGNGCLGLPEYEPFEAIVVSASCRVIPLPLIAQLANGGRIIAPVGGGPEEQRLIMAIKKHHKLIRKDFGAVRFVPLAENK